MALDTKQKQGSVLGYGMPFRSWLAEPTASLTTTDHLSLLKLASDVSPSQAVESRAGGRFLRGLTARRFVREDPGRRFVRGRTERRFYEAGDMAGSGPSPIIQLGVGETRKFAFDFSNFPEVVAGETLSTPVTAGPAGVTFGSPAVLAAPFTYDDAGNTVAAGKGVSVNITGVTASNSEYVIRCTVTASGGGTLILWHRVRVVAVS